jgi:hypothetical protein
MLHLRRDSQLLDCLANRLEWTELVLSRIETVGIRPVGRVNGFLEPFRKIAIKLCFVGPRLSALPQPREKISTSAIWIARRLVSSYRAQ